MTALQALAHPASGRRELAAAELGDLLRSGALDQDTAHLVVGHLVSLAVNEPVTAVCESALNSVSEAFNHHTLPLGLVRPLAATMPTMEPELLAQTLYIFGATHDPQALPLIEPAFQHPDPGVREEARLAAGEITAAR